jgi:hypothetical protein
MDKTQEKILNGYISYVLEQKKRPSTVHAFVEGMKLKEGTFFKYYTGFDQLEREFWSGIFDSTLENIQGEEVYTSYSVNEKLLSFYFAWIESLKDFREFTAFMIKQQKFYELYPVALDAFKKKFEDFAAQLVQEGLATGEIANRMFLSDKYQYALWLQPLSIIKFWVKDKSENFADTDALIEKTVNFSFDIMRSNTIDSFFDLAKFHIQHF